MKRERWSKEQLDYFENSYGTISIQRISKKLNKSVEALLVKAHKLGMGGVTKNIDALTPYTLSGILNITPHTVSNWMNRYDLPFIQKIVINKKQKFIKIEAFWKWAEANKHMVDFSKMESKLLGPEPEWVEEKRNADIVKNMKIRRSFSTPWSNEEDRLLISMLKAFKYSYVEISERIGRSEGAISKRIETLELKERPIKQQVYSPPLPHKEKRKPRLWSEYEEQKLIKLCEQNKTVYEIATTLDRTLSSVKNRMKKLKVRARPIDEYTPEQVHTIVTLIEKGYSMPDIAKRVGKTSLAVRGKLERMGYRFKNGVPYKQDRYSRHEGTGA